MKKPIPFGKYYLLERVNVGGMAEVFKAKAFGVEGFERLLAVKRILPNIAEDEEFITMFIDEAKIAVQLNHANIAQIFDLGKVDDSYFIALEYIHGKDLRAIFDRCRASGENMPIAQACFIIMKVCEGLDYAHNKRDATGRELGLVHRDVSPQNVLISYEGEVKLIDFGIAKAAGKASKTQAGILKGKFGYMSPEQVRGMPLTRVSDIFSVGIVLYELLTGERLFIGESDFSTLEKVRNVEILPPSTYNRKIPEELERIVLKALAKDPEDRYGHAIDLHDELQAFMYTAGEFYSRKDLAAWMKRTFAREIAEESRKLEEYRNLAPPTAPSRPQLPNAGGQSRQPPPAYGAAASVSSATEEADLDWDDEEIETQLYDREVDEFGAPMQGQGGGPPPPAPAHAPLAPPAPAMPSGLPPPGRRPDAALKSTLMGIGSMPAPLPGGPAPLPRPGLPPLPQTQPIDDPFAIPPSPPAPAEPYYDPMAQMAPPQPAGRASGADLAPRRKSGGAGKTVAIVLSLLLLLAGGAAAVYFFVLKDKPVGTLRVKVSPEGATVQIDDNATLHPTPLTIRLAPGPYRLAIAKKGYATLYKDVEIKPGHEQEIELALKPTLGGPEPGPKGFFNLISKPTGAEVELDGKVLGQKTDIRVEVPSGDHTLRLSKPGFHPWPPDGPHKLAVAPGENPTIQQVLIPQRLQLVISASNVSPGEASFTVFRDGSKIVDGTVPKTVPIKDVDPKASYQVVITAKGHPPWSKKLSYDGSDEITIHAPFSGASVAVDRPPPMLPRDPPTPRDPPPPRIPRDPPPMRPMDPPPPMLPRDPPPMRPVDTAGTGTLRINTKPWTQVYINGKLHGTTPLLNVKLPAGTYKVVMLNNNFGIRKTLSVTINKGATTTVIRNLQE